MAFAGKKQKRPADTWVCGCQTTQPARILFCGRCQQGQKKEKT